MWDVIVADITDDAILGMDFLVAYDCHIHPGTGTVTCRGNQAFSNPTGHLEQNSTYVRNYEKLVLPPNSEVVVSGHVKTALPPGQWGLIESSINWRLGPEVLVAKEVVNINSSRIPVRMVNLSSHPKIIHKGTPLGVIGQISKIYTETSTSKTSNSNDQLPEFLQDLYHRSCEGLSTDECHDVKQLLSEFSDVFASSNLDLGEASETLHVIDVGNAVPTKQRFRRLPLATQEEVNKLVDDMLKARVIEESDSPWCSSIVVVRKPDNTIRLCLDYRDVNAVTKADSYDR
ncbi:uncharacterized protein LOC141911536 [Tubulanus polymorphus]|uniref:uncharacterized protein LOC141911536 n=1 Tax=Tubulanus polymorphus TaxID=672921 RepID=UPI003DA28A28